METRALNVCRSRPLPEHAKDSEEDETPVRTGEIEYEQGDRLFMTQILPEPTAEDLRAASMTFQKLAEGACQSAEAWREPFIPPDCVRGFESVFAKEDFDILPEHRQWDHAIELIPGSEPKSSKVYSLSPVEQKELDAEKGKRNVDCDKQIEKAVTAPNCVLKGLWREGGSYEGDQSRALQEIPQFKLCYRICYNSPPGDSSEN